MKGSCLVTRFPRGELKWTRRRLKLLKGCPIQGTLKVFVVFLGHAGFHRRFIKDFSKTSKTLTNILQKYVPFVFDEYFNTAAMSLTPESPWKSPEFLVKVVVTRISRRCMDELNGASLRR